ncbi:hypothetical protein DPMN_179049 [Dreissena polymorpha]|uniref:Uncharacterized protein n=1 Tax=Dreissena polymorpha TaxID=45954 RepID=A0A9D4ED98_DREPO|nr:hypothetical protein DPMN_179049 [Dreissena polymorpha]
MDRTKRQSRVTRNGKGIDTPMESVKMEVDIQIEYRLNISSNDLNQQQKTNTKRFYDKARMTQSRWKKP